MTHQSLRTIPWVREWASRLNNLDAISNQIGQPRGIVRATVRDVNDPLNRGRVRVVFDAFNAEDIPQVEGAGIFSGSRQGESQLSHWIDTCPAFEGKQPPGLIGKRVQVATSEGQYYYAILQDVLYDPELLVSSSAERLSVPNNSTMTRLPIYPAGQLPPASPNNLGCTVIEEGGPMNSDWVCVCLRRDGKYVWVRHSDLAHGHAGGNDTTSQVTSSGDRPNPGQVGAIYDHVFPTSHQEMQKWSAYFTGPAGNPWGEFARWNPPPMSDVLPREFKTGILFDQGVALGQVRSSGYTDSIPGSLTTLYDPSIPSSPEVVPGVNFPQQAIDSAQRALEAASSLQQGIQDPTGFVKETALATLQSYIPAATKAVLENLSNPQALAQTLYSSLKKALGL
jgi:hypothetical protein